MSEISERNLAKAENAIIDLAQSLGFTEKEIVEFIEMGMLQDSAKIMGDSMKKSYQYIINELNATFDVY